MSGNSIGQQFQVTTFGESHGLALGAIVDGCPPGLALTEQDLQPDLNRRRPGQSKYTTQRKEPDQVKILSGVFEGRTTGTSIGLLIENADQKRHLLSTGKLPHLLDLGASSEADLYSDARILASSGAAR